MSFQYISEAADPPDHGIARSNLSFQETLDLVLDNFR